MLCVILVAVPKPSYGAPREVKEWSYTELFESSDVVLVGRLRSLLVVDGAASTTSKEEEPPWQDLEGDAGDLMRKHIVPLDATISVELLLKGDVKGKELHVLVYGYRNQNPGIMSGPRFLPRRSLSANDPVPMVLFLRRGPGHRFVATTGQVDPVDSIHVLMPVAEWKNAIESRETPQQPHETPESVRARIERIRKAALEKQEREADTQKGTNAVPNKEKVNDQDR